MNEIHRNTGRSHNLILQAMYYTDRGIRVVVYTTEHHKRHLENQARAIYHPRVPPGNLSIAAIPDDFDWEKLKRRDTRGPDHLVLVDHHAIEKHLSYIDEEIQVLQRQVRELYPLTADQDFPVPAHIKQFASEFEKAKKSMAEKIAYTEEHNT